MKKFILPILISLLSVSFISCNSDNDNDPPALGAIVNVYVKNELGAEKTGITVYMFDEEVDSSTTRAESKKQVVTNENGLAHFEFTFTELNIIESQTSIYFAVFYTLGNEEIPAGSQGITVERNNTYTVNITIPL